MEEIKPLRIDENQSNPETRHYDFINPMQLVSTAYFCPSRIDWVDKNDISYLNALKF
ncbi:hypothetical protein PYCH_14530 [Pyrococcus yayanosii CH1]|uniref:Uncharacterized protein n=1 Tax=Pyrococcus yayanosii (strain CH1 / JCM 16557) TaxID=529709 RepID=F8AGC7_PYRYC|nr:hypothetical protein PYCH_14530 [Pyrococcus yayanosii CH1]